jgi:hypothetical protein
MQAQSRNRSDADGAQRFAATGARTSSRFERRRHQPAASLPPGSRDPEGVVIDAASPGGDRTDHGSAASRVPVPRPDDPQPLSRHRPKPRVGARGRARRLDVALELRESSCARRRAPMAATEPCRSPCGFEPERTTRSRGRAQRARLGRSERPRRARRRNTPRAPRAPAISPAARVSASPAPRARGGEPPRPARGRRGR